MAVRLDDRVRHDLSKGLLDLDDHDVIELEPGDYTETADEPASQPEPEPEPSAAAAPDPTSKPPAPARKLATAAQRKRVVAMFEEQQIGDARAWLSGELGRDVPFVEDVTRDEATRVIAALERERDAGGAVDAEIVEDEPTASAADERQVLVDTIKSLADASGITGAELSAMCQHRYGVASHPQMDLADLSDLADHLAYLREAGDVDA
jgi:hypothetical protein